MRNYLGDDSWFGEISGTALLTATAYRMAVLASEAFGKSYTDWTDEKRELIEQHMGADSILSLAVNPLN